VITKLLIVYISVPVVPVWHHGHSRFHSISIPAFGSRQRNRVISGPILPQIRLDIHSTLAFCCESVSGLVHDTNIDKWV